MGEEADQKLEFEGPNYMIYSEIGQIECDCKTEKIRGG